MTFVVWGLVHGMFLMFESYKIIPLEKIKFKPVKHFYTMIVVIVTFVIFRAENLTQAFTYISNMFTGFNISYASKSIFFEQFDYHFIFIVILGILFSCPIVGTVSNKIYSKATGTASKLLFECTSYVITLAMFFLCIVSLASSTFNPFIYLQF